MSRFPRFSMIPEGEKNNFQNFQDFAKRETLVFAREHVGEDTARLLLSAARYPSIDMPAAVQQIEGLRTAREKWPSLLDCDDYIYPPRLNREQASSEATARHKASLLPSITVADLTGGMGIDTLAFARVADHVDYVERDPELCALMEHNIKALGISNVSVHCADSMEWLLSQFSTLNSQFTIIYIDPARRSAAGRKVAAFEDCTPNILEHAELLRQHCRHLMVKASPMIDIDLACRQLGDVSEVHVVGAKGECKEVLFTCGELQGEPQIVCRDIKVPKDPKDLKDFTVFAFSRSEEAAAEGRYCREVGHWLYEPDATLMKAGPFKLIAQRYDLEQLGRNTHLYTADRHVEDFPGRVFEVLQELKLSRKEVYVALPEGKAHVVTRNYPVEAATLQKQLGLKEGGEKFVIATTIGTSKRGFLAKI